MLFKNISILGLLILSVQVAQSSQCVEPKKREILCRQATTSEDSYLRCMNNAGLEDVCMPIEGSVQKTGLEKFQDYWGRFRLPSRYIGSHNPHTGLISIKQAAELMDQLNLLSKDVVLCHGDADSDCHGLSLRKSTFEISKTCKVQIVLPQMEQPPDDGAGIGVSNTIMITADQKNWFLLNHEGVGWPQLAQRNNGTKFLSLSTEYIPTMFERVNHEYSIIFSDLGRQCQVKRMIEKKPSVPN